VTFATVEARDRWSKRAIAVVSEKNTELSIFVGWLKGDLLPIDGDKLAHHDPITKSLHAQWERFKMKDGIIYRRYWENRGEKDVHASVTGEHIGVKKRRQKSRDARIG